MPRVVFAPERPNTPMRYEFPPTMQEMWPMFTTGMVTPPQVPLLGGGQAQFVPSRSKLGGVPMKEFDDLLDS